MTDNLRTHEQKSTPEKTKFEEYIFMHSRMNRGLCLDLGARISSRYFHYNIVIKWFIRFY